ncbi:B-cell receptor CD22-like isoform X1 [Brachyhypopomus gauderio]|uniref:B-cell receptor CD22-like isoform X1 n=1 Tax=Brachyhypopomus gauderio TaxID=698409 RepID=UPI004043402C
MSLQTSGNVVMAAILMLLAGAQNSLALSSQSLCAVTGSIVNIPCSIYDSSITERQWYQVQRSDGESQDLSTNPQYSGRVSISTLRNDCTLTIKDVTGSDSGVYNFRFRTQGDEWIYFSPGVTLTVTDLQVKVDPETVGQREVKLTCSSTCNITEALWSRWFWNEVYWGYRPGASIVLNSTILDNQGSFSCRMSGSEHHSPAVYPPRNTRAVMVPSGERVEGDSVTLTCSSDANPPVLTYSWFKQRAAADTLLGTGQNYSITNISSQHSGLYYCTAHNQLGHHNSTTVLLDVLHPPRNTRAVMVPSGERVEGDSVTLTCSSDANPPVLTYSWFKQRAAADTQLGTGQNYSITNISSQHSGLYYCTAHNQLGQHNSTTILLDVLRSPAGTYTASGVSVGLFLTLTAVCLWMSRRRAVSSRRDQTSTNQDSAPVHDNISALAVTSVPTQRASSDDQYNCHYASVHFTCSPTQEVPVYSTVQRPKPLIQENEVEYATVNIT